MKVVREWIAWISGSGGMPDRRAQWDLAVTVVASLLIFCLLELSGACQLLLAMIRTTPALFHTLVFGASGGFGLLILLWLHHRRMEQHAATRMLERRRNEQMRISIERAEAGCRASLASLGHDLRSPLNAVTGFSEILAEDELDLGLPGAYREYALHVARAGHELGRMVQDLLQVLQEFQTLAARDTRSVSLSNLLNEVSARMRVIARARDVALAMPQSVRDEDCAVSAHPLLMATMLDGLTRFLLHLARPKSVITMSIEQAECRLPLVLRLRLSPGRNAEEQLAHWQKIRELSLDDDGWTSRSTNPALHALRGGLLLCRASLEGPTWTRSGKLEFRLFLPRWEEEQQGPAQRHAISDRWKAGGSLRLLQQG